LTVLHEKFRILVQPGSVKGKIIRPQRVHGAIARLSHKGCSQVQPAFVATLYM